MSSNNNNTNSNHNSSSGDESVPNLNSCGSKPVGHLPNLGPYFLDLACLGSARSYLTSFWSYSMCDAVWDDEEEPAPTELDTINSSGGFLVVSMDKLSIKYTNVNLHGHDIVVVQGNRPAPTKRLVYYFEIYVKDAGAKGQIAIGFTGENFKMWRQPGYY